MYHIGEKIMHRQAGACYIKQITDMDVDDVLKHYYVLEPLLDTKSCIYVSMDENKQKNIRPVIKPEELKNALSEADSNPMEWMENPKQRYVQFNKLIASFSFQDMLLTFQCLSAQKSESKLNANDEQSLTSVQKLLFSEMSVILNVKYDDIVKNPSHFMNVH